MPARRWSVAAGQWQFTSQQPRRLLDRGRVAGGGPAFALELAVAVGFRGLVVQQINLGKKELLDAGHCLGFFGYSTG